MNRTHTIVLPDREIKLSLPVSGPVGCTPDPTGLYWFSDLTGDFTEIAEAAYVLPVSTDPEKPTDTVAATLGIAKVLGETCGAVTWTVTWTPDVENGGPPGWKEDGLELQVYPRHDTAPGVLSVTAQCAGRAFGPVTLTLALFVSAPGECCPDPVKLPVIPLGFPGESPGPLDYFLLAIGGSGLHDKIDVGWSVSPSDPNRVALTWYDFSPLAVGLCVAPPDGDADPFRVTVTAALSWVCADVPHATTFVWELDYPPVS